MDISRPELKELDRMPNSVHSSLNPEEFLGVKDYKELILAGLSLLIGMGISVGGCALHVRDAMEKRKAQREVEKIPAQEQKATPIMLRQIQNKKILDK